MDLNCKRVVKKKRLLLCEVLDFTVSSQQIYKKKGILNDEMIPEILVRKPLPFIKILYFTIFYCTYPCISYILLYFIVHIPI